MKRRWKVFMLWGWEKLECQPVKAYRSISFIFVIIRRVGTYFQVDKKIDRDHWIILHTIFELMYNRGRRRAARDPCHLNLRYTPTNDNSEAHLRSLIGHQFQRQHWKSGMEMLKLNFFNNPDGTFSLQCTLDLGPSNLYSIALGKEKRRDRSCAIQGSGVHGTSISYGLAPMLRPWRLP
jgi:hypothetical protein